MARQLAFWKSEGGIGSDYMEVFQAACVEGKTVPGLAQLPLSDILLKAKKVFRDYERLDDYHYGGMEGNVTIRTQPQALVFDCSLRMSDEECKKIINMMKEFGCAYFDPQTGTLYDS